MVLRKPLEFKSVPVVCAWCGKLYKINRWKMDQRKTHKSHGVCKECFEKYREKNSEDIF
jgi:hypothetical protein